MSLVEHARNELALIGEDEWMTEGIVRVVEAFASMGHSGTSAAWCINVLEKLLRFQTLSPLTSDPKEWLRHDKDITGDVSTWQSLRNPAVFSKDGGQSWYNLDDSFLEDNADDDTPPAS